MDRVYRGDTFKSRMGCGAIEAPMFGGGDDMRWMREGGRVVYWT